LSPQRNAGLANALTYSSRIKEREIFFDASEIFLEQTQGFIVICLIVGFTIWWTLLLIQPPLILNPEWMSNTVQGICSNKEMMGDAFAPVGYWKVWLAEFTEKESFDPLKLLPESNPHPTNVKRLALVLASFIIVSSIGVILPGLEVVSA
jgi:hypothetical protein